MSILKQIAQENGYMFDSQGPIMYGQKNNYIFLASEVGNGVITLLFSVKNDSAVQSLDAKVVKQENPAIAHVSFKNHKLTVTVKGGLTKSKRKAKVLEALESVTAYLSTHSYVQVCEMTGETKDVHLYQVGNQYSFLTTEAFGKVRESVTAYLSTHSYVQVCEMTGETKDVHLYQIGNQYSFLTTEAFGKVSREMDRSEQESFQASENIFLGFIGAVLGSLIGVAAIVFVGQLGYISYISGLVMGVCVVKGYELLAKRFSTKGAIISIIVSLVMTFFANQLDWAVSFQRYYGLSIFDTLPYIHEFLAEGYIDSYTYYFNLAFVFIFNAITPKYFS